MDGLLQRVQRQQTERGVDGRLRGAGLVLMAEEPDERLNRQLVQPFAFRREPLVEGTLVERQAGQKVASVDGGNLLESLGRPVGHQPLEQRHVHSHR